MRKLGIITSLVFVLAIWAEWVMLGNPSTGVVLGMKYQHTDDFKLHVMNSEGAMMEIRLPARVWRDWLQPRVIEEK